MLKAFSGQKFRDVCAVLWVILVLFGALRIVMSKSDGVEVLGMTCLGWVGARVIREGFDAVDRLIKKDRDGTGPNEPPATA